MVILSSFSLAVIIQPGTQFKPSSSNIIYNITEQINSTSINISDICLNISDPKFNDSYCLSSGILNIIQLPNTNYTNIIENVTISSLNVTEGDIITFELIENETITPSWINWVLNGIKQATGNLWNWIVSYDSFENSPNNISVYVRETDGQAYRYDLFINVDDENLAPIVEDFYQTPTLTNFSNNLITMFCNVSDEDLSSDQLNVSMAYRLSSNNQWVNVNPTYNPLTDLWTNSFSTAPQYNWITTLDFRCSVTDQKSGYSGFQYDYDSVQVVGEQVSPTIPTIITPKNGNFDVVIPLECKGAIDGNLDAFAYVLEARFNNTFKEIGRHFPKLTYEWDISNFRFNETQIRCYSTDYHENSSYIYTNNLTITHKVNHYLYNKNLKLVPKVNERVIFESYCNTLNSTNLKINSIYLDCNNDNLFDYYYSFENQTKKIISKKMSCLYSESERYLLESGCVVERINSSISWINETICNNLEIDDTYCNILRNRNIEVLSNE